MKYKNLPNSATWSEDVLKEFYSAFPSAPIESVQVSWITKDDKDADGVIMFTMTGLPFIAPIIIRDNSLKPMDVVVDSNQSMNILNAQYFSNIVQGVSIGKVVSKQQLKEPNPSKPSGSNTDLFSKFAYFTPSKQKIDEVRRLLKTAEFSDAIRNPLFSFIMKTCIKLAEEVMVEREHTSKVKSLFKQASKIKIVKDGAMVTTKEDNSIMVSGKNLRKIASESSFVSTSDNGDYVRDFDTIVITDSRLNILYKEGAYTGKLAITKTPKFTLEKRAARSLAAGDIFVIDSDSCFKVKSVIKYNDVVLGVGHPVSTKTLEKEASETSVDTDFKVNPLLMTHFYDDTKNCLNVSKTVSILSPTFLTKEGSSFNSTDTNTFESHNIHYFDAGKIQIDDSVIRESEFVDKMRSIGLLKIADNVERLKASNKDLMVFVKRADSLEEDEVIQLPSLPTSLLLKIAYAVAANKTTEDPASSMSIMAPLLMNTITKKNFEKVIMDIVSLKDMLLSLYLASKKEDINVQEELLFNAADTLNDFLVSISSNAAA